ncbi:HNH endonuclease, partial [Promicromonospora sp. NPDC023987]
IVRDPETGITTWTTPTGRVHTRPPTVLDTHTNLDQIDPDTSHDLSLRALTGQRLPRSYQTTEPGAIPNEATPTQATPTDPDQPPF